MLQPHTYSRTKALFDGFLTCFDEADEVLVTDICGAREVDPGDINSGMLVDAMVKKGIHAHLTPSFDDAEALSARALAARRRGRHPRLRRH